MAGSANYIDLRDMGSVPSIPGFPVPGFPSAPDYRPGGRNRNETTPWPYLRARWRSPIRPKSFGNFHFRTADLAASFRSCTLCDVAWSWSIAHTYTTVPSRFMVIRREIVTGRVCSSTPDGKAGSGGSPSGCHMKSCNRTTPFCGLRHFGTSAPAPIVSVMKARNNQHSRACPKLI
jgi:hypothetical protein